MGTNSLTYDNAGAITPSLFIGHYLSIEHQKFVDPQEAIRAINAGLTVLVDNNTDALLVLIGLGVSIADGLNKIKLATTVNTDKTLSI